MCKMNVDTDTQWAYWEGLPMEVLCRLRWFEPVGPMFFMDFWCSWKGPRGLKNFYKAKEGYLQGQIGNPEGEEQGFAFKHAFKSMSFIPSFWAV